MNHFKKDWTVSSILKGGADMKSYYLMLKFWNLGMTKSVMTGSHLMKTV